MNHELDVSNACDAAQLGQRGSQIFQSPAGSIQAVLRRRCVEQCKTRC
jgi:hypothetical protein